MRKFNKFTSEPINKIFMNIFTLWVRRVNNEFLYLFERRARSFGIKPFVENQFSRMHNIS